MINNKKEDVVTRISELTGGKGAKLLIEASGAVQALRDCLKVTPKYGRISIVSFYERDIDEFPIDSLVLGCKVITGAAGCMGNAPAVCEIMCKNPVKLAPVISHHIPFEKCLDVFEHEADYHNEKIKIMVDFE